MKQELEIAKQLIDEKQFDRARSLLRKLGDDPTAKQWLEKLNQLAPPAQAQSSSANGGTVKQEDGWQYASMEVKRSYGISYRVNGEAKADWKDQPIYYALNELGREGWELVNFGDGPNETTIYLFKKAGAAAENLKAQIWDQ